MKFKDVADCDECQLQGDYCSNHPDGYHPCEFMMEEYGEMEMEELIKLINKRQIEAEEREDKRLQKEKEKQKCELAIKEKRMETYYKNYSENKEIRQCKSRIKKLTNSKNSIEASILATHAVNFMFGYTKEEKPKQKSEIVIEIENKIIELEERIKELNKIKKSKK